MTYDADDERRLHASFSRRGLMKASAATCAAALVRLSSASAQQAWPAHPIKIVVPFEPGGPPDLIARMLAEQFSSDIGGVFVVENRAGAGSIIGVTGVARSEPDGYTLLVATSAFILNKALNPQVQYDPVRDFTPICEIATSPNVFTVSKALGVNSLKELRALAMSRPNGINYTSPGVGTTPQMSAELLRVRAGIPMTHVPFKGGPQAAQALLSGHVQLLCSSVPLVQPHIEAGTMVPLAVTGAQRWRGMPNVPTMAEAGFDNFVLDTMVMLSAPAKLPPAISDRLSAACQKALKLESVHAAIDKMGFDVIASTPEQIAARVKREVTTWSDVVAVAQAEKK
jgi:tripartite-type tricarboxylate transporter receptor subunit TctC